MYEKVDALVEAGTLTEKEAKAFKLDNGPGAQKPRGTVSEPVKGDGCYCGGCVKVWALL